MNAANDAWREWDTCELDETHRFAKSAFLAGYRQALLDAADDISENHYLLLPVGAEVGEQVMPDNWLRDRAEEGTDHDA